MIEYILWGVIVLNVIFIFLTKERYRKMGILIAQAKLELKDIANLYETAVSDKEEASKTLKEVSKLLAEMKVGQNKIECAND